ncbi:MAG: branched-chain amino acid ABC transporter permease [Gaiellaceae bacterium]
MRLLGPLAVLALAVLIGVLPLVMSDYHSLQGAYVGMYFVAILGLNILTGYTGQISLGHGAFMAIGGYTTAIMWGRHHVGPVLTMPIAGLVAGLAGLLFGLPALRLSGLYLALATFAVAVSVPAFAKTFTHLTGGQSGIILGIHSGVWLYRTAWISGGTCFVLAWLVLRGRTGRAFRAIRDSEVAAVSSGVSLSVYKTLAFGISAAFAGVAGSLLTLIAAYANPDTFPILLSLYILIGAVVAGLGSNWGLVIGALFVEFLPIDAQRSIPLGVYTLKLGKEAPSVVYGIVLILIMFLLPSGVAGVLRRLGGPVQNLFRAR